MTLQRRTGLQRRTRLQAGGPIKRKAMPARLPEVPTRRHPTPKGPDARTVAGVVERDEGCCVVCDVYVLGGVRGLNYSIHHRRFRDGKPDSHSPQNLILVCGGSNVDLDHGRIHQSRSWAKPHGYWLSRVAGANPLLAPVYVAKLGRLVWLTERFKYTDEPPAGSVAA